MKKIAGSIVSHVVENVAGYAALFLAVLSVGAGMWTQVQISDKSSCQTAINQEFLTTLKQRATIWKENTDSINNLIKGVFNTKDPKVALQDYQNYLTELDTINGELGKATYPDFGSC